jgi:hypothetical protein
VAYTYNLATDVGRCRLMIPDRVEAEAIFQDEEISAFLALEGGVKGATALALETIASDQVLTLKVAKILDKETDGAKVSDALLKRAAKLREQVASEEAVEEDGAFAVAEMVTDDFGYRERIWNEALRNG